MRMVDWTNAVFSPSFVRMVEKLKCIWNASVVLENGFVE